MAYSYREVAKILKENGWQLKRTSGSHESMLTLKEKLVQLNVQVKTYH